MAKEHKGWQMVRLVEDMIFMLMVTNVFTLAKLSTDSLRRCLAYLTGIEEVNTNKEEDSGMGVRMLKPFQSSPSTKEWKLLMWNYPSARQPLKRTIPLVGAVFLDNMVKKICYCVCEVGDVLGPTVNATEFK